MQTVLPLAALVVVALVWLSTLQTAIGAANIPAPDPTGMIGPLMDDSGEFVVAWHTWGDSHPPGYPLLNLLANVLTRVLRELGTAPVTAASLVSCAFALAALALVARQVWTAGGSGPASASAILLPAFGGLVWLYASVAEVYSLGLALGFAAVALALEAGARPRARVVLALAFVFGLAIGHHRTLIAILPALAVAAWPARRLGWRVWLGAGTLVVLSLGVYAYLPLAALAGSPWIYGRSPATLDGFLDALLAREYTGQLAPPTTSVDIATALAGRVMFLAGELPPGGIVLGAAGLAIALTRPLTRTPAAVLGLIVAAYLLAPVGQYLLIGTHLLVMVSSLAMAATWGLGLAAIASWRPGAAWAGLALTIAVAAMGYVAQRESVVAHTRDPLGRQLIDAMAALPEANPTVLEEWGPRYFALAYGKWAGGELSHVRLIDVRADLAGLPQAGDLPPDLYTSQDLLYRVPPDVWAGRLSTPVAVESAGDGIVVIRRQPRLATAHVVTATVTGAGDIALATARAWLTSGGDLRLTVEWRALRKPAGDYHVFVHVSARDEISGPDDLLAQGDRQHPVYGFYPTSRWSPREQVRDDFRIPLPAGRAPVAVFVGLYTVGADGSFTNHLRSVVPISAGP